jgi:hypothetical protein
MDVGTLGIIEINDTPPPLQLTPEEMALALEGGNVQAMPQFIGQGQWTDDALLHRHWGLVDATLGEADGVCIVDGSDCPKQGEHSVGGGPPGVWPLGKSRPLPSGGVHRVHQAHRVYTA